LEQATATYLNPKSYINNGDDVALFVSPYATFDKAGTKIDIG